MEAAAPRLASTIAILRDGADGIDVWLMRRSSGMVFAAGMQAFPGGAVENDDYDVLLPWAGPPAATFSDVIGVPGDIVAALISAAVRETFEESGALLASGASSIDDHEAARVALVEGELGWVEFLVRGGLAVDAAALVPWSRWITPSWSPRRFDAYFFLAAVPAGPGPRWIDGEADQAGWVSAAAAVAAHERGHLPMLPPTIETLRAIARHASVGEALASGPLRITTEDG